jgi:hypothetical protein
MMATRPATDSVAFTTNKDDDFTFTVVSFHSNTFIDFQNNFKSPLQEHKKCHDKISKITQGRDTNRIVCVAISISAPKPHDISIL